MNGLNDTREDSPTWELANAPQATPPTLAMVAGEVKRRKRQKAYNLATIAAVLFCCGVGISRWFDVDPNSPADPSIALAPQERTPGGAIVPAPGTPGPKSPSGFTLYADIHSHAPVFQYDDRRDAMVPVGWVRSTDTVPVDLRAFPPERLENFHDLLFEEADKTVY